MNLLLIFPTNTAGAPGLLRRSRSQNAQHRPVGRREKIAARHKAGVAVFDDGVVLAGTPLGQLGMAKDIAAAAVFLVSLKAAFIADVCRQVVGGMSIGL